MGVLPGTQHRVCGRLSPISWTLPCEPGVQQPGPRVSDRQTARVTSKPWSQPCPPHTQVSTPRTANTGEMGTPNGPGIIPMSALTGAGRGLGSRIPERQGPPISETDQVLTPATGPTGNPRRFLVRKAPPTLWEQGRLWFPDASPIQSHTPLCRGSAFLHLLGAYGAAFRVAVSSEIRGVCARVCGVWCVRITLEPSRMPGLSISSKKPGARAALEKRGQAGFPVSLGQ